MARKPTYEELQQRVKELEKEVSKRKRAQEGLRESEERLKTVVNNVNDVIFQVSPLGFIQYVSPKVKEIYGYNPEELIGKHLRKTTPVSEVPKALEALKRVLSGKTVKNLEINQLDSRGKIIPMEINVTPVKKGGKIIAAQGVMRDISERKWAEEALKREKERAEGYLDIARVMLTVVSAEENITLINKKGCEILGYHEEELIGRNWFDILVPERMRGEVRGVFGKLMAGDIEPVEYYENPLLTKDGEERLILFHNTVIRDSNGHIVGVLTSGEDITERVQAEKALRESEERYRTLFENATDAIFIADTNTNIILDANRQAERLIGRPRDEIIGMHQSKLHPPQQAEYYNDKFRRHVQKGRFLDLQAEIIKKDGSIVPVFINASVINLHGKKIIQGLFKDITEEKVILDLRKEMAVRTLIEKAKGMLMDRHNISKKEAVRRLQKESRRQRKEIEEIAKDLISSELFLK